MTNVNIKTQQESFVFNSNEVSIKDSMNDISSKIVNVLEDNEDGRITYIIAVSVIEINTTFS
jgi:hypothetical protein